MLRLLRKLGESKLYGVFVALLLFAELIFIILVSAPSLADVVSDNPVAIVVGRHLLSVEKQPLLDQTYVTETPDTVTLLSVPAFAVAAHGYLAGAEFTQLGIGDEIIVLFEPEQGWEKFTVVDIQRFTALDPKSPYSDFVDERGDKLSTLEVYLRVYEIAGRLVLQTCEDGLNRRVFVIAERSGGMDK